MLSNAFRGTVKEESAQRNQVINTATTGIKDLATGVAGVLGFANVFQSAKVDAALEHAFASRVGGIGGNIMLASLQEKKESTQANEENKLFSAEEVGATIKSTLGDNPINRSATKQLSTVFETLQRAKEEQIINKQGQIDTSFGKVDPNSELGKKILGDLKNDNDR